MGKRDFSHRETRKPKKDAKKNTTPPVTYQSEPVVEVIKKGKKPSDTSEE